MNTLKLLAENISRIPEDLYFDLIISLKKDLKKEPIQFTSYEKNEILSDMSEIVGENFFAKDLKIIEDLFSGSPKHDKLYYTINNLYGKKIPKWFAERYPNVNDMYPIDDLDNFSKPEKETILSDISIIIGEKLVDECKEKLFSGSPKYDNLYYTINKYGKKIPKWFVEKYPNVNDGYTIE